MSDLFTTRKFRCPACKAIIEATGEVLSLGDLRAVVQQAHAMKSHGGKHPWPYVTLSRSTKEPTEHLGTVMTIG